MKDFAPIVLFVYNRPSHTKKVVDGLLNNDEAKYSDLYIFADGAKQSITEDGLKKLKEVRDYIHTIKGFRNVYIDESDTNRGLANSTIRGCSKVINKYGCMIMMEDDDVPNEFFLDYMNRTLVKFKDDTSIWCVGGYTDTGIIPVKEGEDLFLVNRPTSWGFGTWKRCWDKVIWDIETLKGLFSHKDIRRSYDLWGGLESSYIMMLLFEGKSSSWSIRYNFAAYLNNAYTILPKKSLIENIGCDGSGTHCGIIDYNLNMMEHKVIIPDQIKFDRKRNKQLWNSFIPKGFKNWIRYVYFRHRLVKKYRKKCFLTYLTNLMF